MRSLSVTLAVVAGSVLLCSPVRADLYFSVGQANYDVLPGQSVVVPVWLDVTSPDVSFLESEEGLFSAGVLVQRTGSSLGQPAGITDMAANTGDFDDPLGPVFDPSLPLTIPVGQASIYELRDFMQTSGVLGDETPSGGGHHIWLGTFTVQAGPTAGELTTFSVSTRGLSYQDTATWLTSTPLDDSIASAEFTITTVPLPSAVLLGFTGMSASGILLYIAGMSTMVMRRRK